jgi:hypothetical protein
MKIIQIGLLAATLAFAAVPASAATFTFQGDPFAGTTALTTPGRQVIGNEAFITFNTASDLFTLITPDFNVPAEVLFANGEIASIPQNNVNVVVLRTFDDDNNLATNFGAGNAANLIANQVTTPGAGFFIYFNQGLNLPRLVFSTDLDSNQADLKIVARMTNLTGDAGRAAMATFEADNFNITQTPEPSTYGLAGLSLLSCVLYKRRRR